MCCVIWVLAVVLMTFLVFWDVILCQLVNSYQCKGGLSIYPVVFNSWHCLLETKRHSSLFFHWSGSKVYVVMAACTPSIHVFLGRPLFLLSCRTTYLGQFGRLQAIKKKYKTFCRLIATLSSANINYIFMSRGNNDCIIC
jgi:hypothetical protein